MTTLVALNLQSNAVMKDTTSRDVACSRCTTSAYNKICHVGACCCRRCCELADTHALSRPTVDLIAADVRYQLIRGSLIFCYIFSHRNGGGLIRGTAYMQAYMVLLQK